MIDLSQAKRRYYSNECGLHSCPECGSKLLEENCTILLGVKSQSDEGEFMTNLSGSHFCNQCPVVVFDNDKLEQAAKIAVRDRNNLGYFIAGIVNLKAIPEEKKSVEIGSDDNPIPLVQFLPDLTNTVISKKKLGRNEICTCGSGRKYKHCCGK
jgi:uncharacterized protein (UPF0212 family)